MNSKLTALSSSIIALSTLRVDASPWTKAAQGNGNPILPSPDPRSAYLFSLPVANVLLSFSDKTHERTTDPSPVDNKLDDRSQKSNPNPVVFRNVRASDAPILQLDLLSISENPSSDIKNITSGLPEYLAKQIESRNSSDFTARPRIHLDDESLVRLARNHVLGVYEIATTDKKAQEWVALHMSHSGPYDPNDARVQAVLNGTAKIVRGPEPVEAGSMLHSKEVYGRDPVTGIVEARGTTTWLETNDKKIAEEDKKLIDDFEQKNPGFTVSPIHLYDDVALVIYPIAPNATQIASQPIT
ncbi:hypothetical protein SAMN05216360_107150 [Methylobacterium phyllostachyos]|uniref:Uncharacterized protein n=1 Tax=Methylobacterium phyllostachyos TaxID=582672 RepID=A0A1H0ADP5_9HYPH|nr:hypothetical protein [Methylobacterium phyllostachyos]SDN31113.1 hypothetical protein SAMN05216360_107150 [Methylobacterium phyllostachyos]